MFTAEEWRIFSRLRLVLPIRPMTSYFTNFTFSERPILHYFWEVPLVPFILSVFFLLRVTYLLLGFTGGLFVITLMSSEWIVHNNSRVLLRSLSKF